MRLDCLYRVRIEHRAGELAQVLSAIADEDGLIGDVHTVNVGRHHSIREITVETDGEERAERIAQRLDGIDGIEVLWHGDRALERHVGGKLTIEPRIHIETWQDMRDVYTPGVARVAQAVADDASNAARYTMIGRTVAICTNGTRVLGLGDIGPTAAMPVMEGKAVLYRELAGVSAMPILIDARGVDEFVETVVRIAPTFGAIQLEDIEAPACFEIEARLIERLDRPVMHDDVHGTAVAALAAVLAGCRYTGHDIEAATIGQIGLGAAGYGIASIAVDAGAQRVIASDPDESAHPRARERGVEIVDLETLMGDADIVVATTGQPGLIEPEMVRDGQIILALTNPEPEIDPDAARDAGAAFALDGAAVNNALGFPGIFRGALEAGASEINEPMKLAAAHAIAEVSEDADLVPDALDPELHRRIAEAVAAAARDSGVARSDHAVEIETQRSRRNGDEREVASRAGLAPG